MSANEAYQRFRPLIAQVLDPRTHTMEWLDGEVERGGLCIWSTGSAIIIAEVEIYPTGARELHGLVAVGDVDTIVHVLIPAAELWARQNAFLFTSISSRPGWARLLKDDGYHVHQVTVRKELI